MDDEIGGAVKLKLTAAAACLAAALASSPATGAGGVTQLTISLERPVDVVRPERALGADLDGQGRGDVAKIYTPANLRRMRSAGFRSIAYRLRTELGVEAWHWSPHGRFSDGDRGYWSASSSAPAGGGASFGYRLPRRGDTIDQANDSGYSRIDDGDSRTFWKSNPYLDPVYAHEAHPQWVLVDLGAPRAVDTIEIAWGTPYATRFRVARWTGALPPARYGAERENATFAGGEPPGRWLPFRGGALSGRRGTQTIRLAPAPVTARWLLVSLIRSSHTAPPGSRDRRDRLGFAIRELFVGRREHGRLVDLIRHGRSRRDQDVVWVSSTDPWHRASDIDRDTEQPSFTRVFTSGLTRGNPVLMPVSLLYGTPADAAAELRYLLRNHDHVAHVELGEEPDGQLASPEDYGALYLEFARALRRVSRHVVLGGPGFSTALPDWTMWPDRHGETSWTARFLRYLRDHRALGELGFFSFEWYPFDDVCSDPARNLAAAPALLDGLLAREHRDGLPARIPEIITEYGYSAFAAEPEVDLAGALFDAGVAGRFLTAGGQAAFLYGYEPQNVMRESRFCNTVGNLMLFRSDDRHRIRAPVAAYWAARLVNRDWLAGGGRAELYRTSLAPADAAVTAYAARRSDGRLALLVVNADRSRQLTVDLAVARRGGTARWRCTATGRQLSAATYAWHTGKGGHATPNRPPARVVVAGGRVTLPPYSLTVVVGGRRC